MSKLKIDVTENIKDRTNAYILTGRKTGEQQREFLRLDDLEKKYEIIIVTTPANYKQVNSSFFLGLFGKSVRKYGSRLEFLKKYQFELPQNILDSVEEGIADALRTGSGLD